MLNLTDARAARARAAALALVRDEPTTLIDTLARLRPSAAPDVNLVLPAHHEVRPEDVDLRRLRATVLAAHERGPRDFADLLMTPGLGARTVRALAHVAEVVHGAPSCFADPARFSLALGGKDGHPCPVPVRVYDETLRVLRDALSRSQLGDDERMGALRTLDAHARRIERAMPSGEGTVDVLRAVVGHDLQNRTLFGGRTVFDAPPAPRTRPRATPATPLPKALRSTPRPRPTGQLPLL